MKSEVPVCQPQWQVPARRPLTKSVSVLKVLTSSKQMVNASQSKIPTYAGSMQEL